MQQLALENDRPIDAGDLDYFARLGGPDRTFRSALGLIRARRMPLAQALQTLHLLLGPRPRLDWTLLRNPTRTECERLADALERIAAAVEGGSEAPTGDAGVAATLGRWPSLVPLAVFHDAVPLDTEEIVGLLGADEAARRMRAFAATLSACARVG